MRTKSLGFGGKNDVADLRYVDDTISLTRVYCRDCIVIRATMIYPPRRGLALMYTCPEDEASSLLQHDVNSKHVVPIFIALRDLDVALLRSLIAGRITRWTQFHLSHNQLREALRHELRLWRRAGYFDEVSSSSENYFIAHFIRCDT